MAKTIKDLPEEMLIEVFEYLDGQMVKEAALVCKEWNRVISTATKVMKKFVLKIASYEIMSHDEFEQLLTVNRQFKSADIYWAGDYSKLMQVIDRFGKRFKKVKLQYFDATTVSAMEILEQMSDLEELELSLPVTTTVGPLAPVLMKKLKKLKVSAGWDILSLIKAPMLSRLNVDESIFTSPGVIGKFLKTSPKLESLRVNDTSVLGEINFPLQLKELEIEWIFDFNDKFEKFLLSQAATLETLTVRNCMDSKLHEIFLTKFKRLESLAINMGELKASEDFYRNLKPMPWLKELYSYDGFASEAAMRAVLGNCPELEDLRIYKEFDKLHNAFVSASNLDFIAENNRKLQTLAISSIESSTVRFQHLQTLILFEVENADHLLAFLNANPTIETLIIQYQFKSSSNDNLETQAQILCDLVEQTDLKQVRVESANEMTEEIRDMIRTRLGTRETIELIEAWDFMQIDIKRDIP